MHPILAAILQMSRKRGMTATDNFIHQLGVNLREMRKLIMDDVTATDEEQHEAVALIDPLLAHMEDYFKVRAAHQAWVAAESATTRKRMRAVGDPSGLSGSH